MFECRADTRTNNPNNKRAGSANPLIVVGGTIFVWALHATWNVMNLGKAPWHAPRLILKVKPYLVPLSSKQLSLQTAARLFPFPALVQCLPRQPVAMYRGLR